MAPINHGNALTLVLAGLSWTALQLACSQNGSARETQVITPIAARITAQNTIDIRVAEPGPSGVTQVVQRSLGYQPAAPVRSLTINASGRYLAFLEATPTEEPSPTSWQLIVLNPTGERVYTSTQHVALHAWADSASLVEIVGIPTEGGTGFRFRNAYRTDVANGERLSIALPGPPHKLEWNAFDNAIYLKTLFSVDGANVFRLDAESNTFESTTHHDVGFSPSGRYYFHAPDEGDPAVRVYDTATDTEVTHPEFTGTVMSWAGGSPHSLVFAPARRARERGLPTQFQIFNPETGEMRTTDETPTGWVTADGTVQLASVN